MKATDVAKVVGGIAVGHLEDRYIPFSYQVAGFDLVRLGLGALQVGLAITQGEKVYGVAKDLLDVLGVAGAQLIVNQVAKFAFPTTPTAISVAPPAPVAVAPTPSATFY